RSKLCGHTVQDRMRAYDILTALNLEESFQGDLFPQGDDPDAAIRARVISLLSRIPCATSRRILERAVSDAAARVRAAALEGLVVVGGPRCHELVMSRFGDESFVARCTAIRVLL